MSLSDKLGTEGCLSREVRENERVGKVVMSGSGASCVSNS